MRAKTNILANNFHFGARKKLTAGKKRPVKLSKILYISLTFGHKPLVKLSSVPLKTVLCKTVFWLAKCNLLRKSQGSTTFIFHPCLYMSFLAEESAKTRQWSEKESFNTSGILDRNLESNRNRKKFGKQVGKRFFILVVFLNNFWFVFVSISK